MKRVFSYPIYLIDEQWNMIDLNGVYEFEFAPVPECNPDIIAPYVDIVFPLLETGSYVALDSYFQFKITDQWKGVKKDSINISIDGIKYDLSNIEHEWSGDLLTIYPDIWLPVWKKVLLSIDVQDKQVYGKANHTKKEYYFETSTGLYLLNDIDPIQFRKLVNKEKYYQWSKLECDLLADVYLNWDDEDKEIVLSISKRLNCNEISLLSGNKLDTSDNIESDKKYSGYSVFAVLGWVLFWLLVFIIIFSYLAKGYKEDSSE